MAEQGYKDKVMGKSKVNFDSAIDNNVSGANNIGSNDEALAIENVQEIQSSENISAEEWEQIEKKLEFLDSFQSEKSTERHIESCHQNPVFLAPQPRQHTSQFDQTSIQFLLDNEQPNPHLFPGNQLNLQNPENSGMFSFQSCDGINQDFLFVSPLRSDESSPNLTNPMTPYYSDISSASAPTPGVTESTMSTSGDVGTASFNNELSSSLPHASVGEFPDSLDLFSLAESEIQNFSLLLNTENANAQLSIETANRAHQQQPIHPHERNLIDTKSTDTWQMTIPQMNANELNISNNPENVSQHLNLDNGEQIETAASATAASSDIPNNQDWGPAYSDFTLDVIDISPPILEDLDSNPELVDEDKETAMEESTAATASMLPRTPLHDVSSNSHSTTSSHSKEETSVSKENINPDASAVKPSSSKIKVNSRKPSSRPSTTTPSPNSISINSSVCYSNQSSSSKRTQEPHISQVNESLNNPGSNSQPSTSHHSRATELSSGPISNLRHPDASDAIPQISRPKVPSIGKPVFFTWKNEEQFYTKSDQSSDSSDDSSSDTSNSTNRGASNDKKNVVPTRGKSTIRSRETANVAQTSSAAAVLETSSHSTVEAQRTSSNERPNRESENQGESSTSQPPARRKRGRPRALTNSADKDLPTTDTASKIQILDNKKYLKQFRPGPEEGATHLTILESSLPPHLVWRIKGRGAITGDRKHYVFYKCFRTNDDDHLMVGSVFTTRYCDGEEGMGIVRDMYQERNWAGAICMNKVTIQFFCFMYKLPEVGNNFSLENLKATLANIHLPPFVSAPKRVLCINDFREWLKHRPPPEPTDSYVDHYYLAGTYYKNTETIDLNLSGGFTYPK
ncbi:dentin sialophosphoprotein isoform X2 [Hyalella azteca]|uniref:Dentin sialophosphoprotein isoform X2 n=1 Tax=Hyalella azteca TaxID=294128 RepID=A0A8B7N225_HYAAZ|nr:dentin sialophosphoprotein isoform X2 [Hyalella azteca]